MLFRSNLPTSTSVATSLVLQEAQAAKNAKIKVLTIGLGADADISTLQSVATTTGGLFYDIPGGQTVSAVQVQLQNVFRQIASSRTLKLIGDQ